MIVSIPAQVVQTAVKQIVDAGIPVFGCNSGFNVAIGLGVLAHVEQGEYVAGVEAAKAFIRVSEGEIVNPLFINHEKGNAGIEHRYWGFYDTNATGVETKLLYIDGFWDEQVVVEKIRPAFTDCPYDIVQMVSARTIDLPISAISDGLFANCTDTDFTCIDDAFPVCTNSKTLDGTESGCPCTERNRI